MDYAKIDRLTLSKSGIKGHSAEALEEVLKSSSESITKSEFDKLSSELLRVQGLTAEELFEERYPSNTSGMWGGA